MFVDSEACGRIECYLLEPETKDCSCPVDEECCGECPGCFHDNEDFADVKRAMVAESMAWDRQEMEGFK